MRKRSLRVTALIFAIAVTIGASYFLWTIQQRNRQIAAADESRRERLARVTDALRLIGTAQQSYVAPGQLHEPWFEETSAQLARLNEDLAALGALVRSQNGAAALGTLVQSTETLAAAEQRIRDNLGHAQELMAADVIFSDGRNLLDAMTNSARSLEQAERAAADLELSALSRNRWIALGATVFSWLVAIVALLRSSPAIPATAEVASTLPSEAADVSVLPPTPAVAPASSLDLTATASVCSEIARVTDSAAFSEALRRALPALEANGLMLWMGAGEQLFAVIGHGYPADTLARLGPLPRDADNAVSTAWRTSRMAAVAGGGSETDALVAPVVGRDGCIGALALEIPHGRSGDPNLRSLVTVVAAQVATAVSAWPAASRPADTDGDAQNRAEMRSA